MLNPDEKFVVETITRNDIAFNLDLVVADGMAGDDDRLTNELCRQYADALVEYEGNRDDGFAWEQFNLEFAKKAGLKVQQLE